MNTKQKNNLSLRKRFSVDLFRCEGGWGFRVLAGLVAFAIKHRYTMDSLWWDRTSSVWIGIIPFRIKNGQRLPGKEFFVRTEPSYKYHP